MHLESPNTATDSELVYIDTGRGTQHPRDPLLLRLSMRVYRGVLNLSKYAVNESLTLIVPGTFDIGQPILAYWQWTEDRDGRLKVPCNQSYTITSARYVGGKHILEFGGWYSWRLEYEDIDTLYANVIEAGDSSSAQLVLDVVNEIKTKSPVLKPINYLLTLVVVVLLVLVGLEAKGVI